MKKLSLLALSCLMLAVSCKKPNDNTKPTSFGFLNGTMNVSMPTVVNGMLSFKDHDQFDNYVDYIDSVSNNPNDSLLNAYQYTDVDIRELILQNIENSLGFSSLRKHTYEKFSQENLIGWDKAENIPTYYKSSKSAEQSVLNNQKEVKIGDYIRKQMGENYEIYIDTKVDVVANNILESARSLSNGYPNGNIPLDEIRTLDYSAKYLNIIDLRTTERVFEPLDDEPIGGYAISGAIQKGDPCIGMINEMTLKSFTLVHVTSWFMGYPGGSPVAAYYDITFGDGQSVNNIYGNGGQFNISFDRLHIYNAPGTYTVTVKAKLTQTGQYVSTKSYSVVITSAHACSRDKKSKIYFFDVSNTQKLRCEIEYWRSWHFPSFQYPRNARVSAEYLVKEGSNWKVKKAEKIGVILASKAFKQNCIVHDDPVFVNNDGYWTRNAGEKNNVSSYSRQSGKIHFYDLYYNTVVGQFLVQANGVTHTKRYEMSACN